MHFDKKSNSDTWLSNYITINHKPKPKFVWFQQNNKTFGVSFVVLGLQFKIFAKAIAIAPLLGQLNYKFTFTVPTKPKKIENTD